MAKSVTLLTCTMGVLDSNLIQESGLTKGFCGFLHPDHTNTGQYLSLDHDLFLPYNFLFVVHYNLFI
jgi:hypothetical protein